MSSIAVRTLALALSLLALVPGCAPAKPDGGGDQPGRLFEQERLLMGTRFAVKVVHDDEDTALRAIEAAFAEVGRVEALLSEWMDSSEISAVNRGAGGPPVAVGPELLEVVRRSLEISEVTGGAFDITFAACGGLWSFRERVVPEDAAIAACLREVGYEAVEVGEGSLALPRPGMRIGIAGIGKGYGVDRAARVLDRHGVEHYVVDGGGDIRLRGRNRGRSWRIGIRHPRRPELYGAVALDHGAIVTSGDYFQFFERDGRRYHHILDPRTGRPARGSLAVTVMAPTAMDADALATGLFVMGPSAGLELVEELDGVEALFFAPDQSVHVSSGFPAIERGTD